MSEYTEHVGEKFNEDGSLRYFPGATVISHLHSENPMHKLMSGIRDAAMKNPYAEAFVFLPPSSFHMTVFDLYSDFERYNPKWSSRINRLLPADEVNRILKRSVDALNTPEGFEMAVDYVDTHSIKLIPADSDCEKSIRSYRDAVSEATGIRFPNHDWYQFHMTFAYPLKTLDEILTIETRRFITRQTATLKEKMPTFTIGRPEFRVYSTMEAFVPFKG